jgi:hypothetical protein
MAKQQYYEIENPELIPQNPQPQPHAQPTNTYQTQQVQQTNDFSISDFFAPVLHWAKIAGIVILLLILTYFFWRLFKYLLAFIYDVFNAKRYIWLRVTLPRSDTKVDREKEREIAKDMKEKIARMAQVYRNLHKL